MAPIRPLVWESPCAVEAALEKAKRQKKKKSYPGNTKCYFKTAFGKNDYNLEKH